MTAVHNILWLKGIYARISFQHYEMTIYLPCALAKKPREGGVGKAERDLETELNLMSTDVNSSMLYLQPLMLGPGCGLREVYALDPAILLFASDVAFRDKVT